MANLFRPDPRRSIHVIGEIGQEMLSRLTPRIIELQAESRDAITVYIDSIGGRVDHSRRIMELLRMPPQGGGPPCRIITVATNMAASAAAVMLCDGDYAIAYPGASIHFHGLRLFPTADVTAEAAHSMTEFLRLGNHDFAMGLARRCIERIMLQFSTRGDPSMSRGFDGFLVLLGNECEAEELVRRAIERMHDYDRLCFEAGACGYDEAEQLHKIIDGLVEANAGRQDWSFARSGIQEVAQELSLATESIEVTNPTTYASALLRWASAFLTLADEQEIESLPKGRRAEARARKGNENAAGQLLRMWCFAAALCHTLQEGEFPLSPGDAFRLGLIDEEIGSQAMTLRDMVESAPVSIPPK